jgi:hypothetical protein
VVFSYHAHPCRTPVCEELPRIPGTSTPVGDSRRCQNPHWGTSHNKHTYQWVIVANIQKRVIIREVSCLPPRHWLSIFSYDVSTLRAAFLKISGVGWPCYSAGSRENDTRVARSHPSIPSPLRCLPNSTTAERPPVQGARHSRGSGCLKLSFGPNRACRRGFRLSFGPNRHVLLLQAALAMH